MAITALEYLVLTDLRHRGILPSRPHMLEFGPQNWYGDVSFKAVENLARELLDNGSEDFRAFKERYDEIVSRVEGGDIVDGLRRFCDLFYRLVLDYDTYMAVDLHDAPDTIQHDLNRPLRLDRRFDVITNIGTAEHVFDIARVFRTAHEVAAPNGLMIHTAPFTGWWNHGFFSIHPTFYFDLAEANGYDLVALTYGMLKPFEAISVEKREDIHDLAKTGRIGEHAVLNCVFRKGAEDRPFETPIQRLYSGLSSKEEIAGWRKFR